MKPTLLCLASVLLACCTGSAQTRSDFEFANTASLARQLRELQHSFTDQNPERLRATLPLAWRVRTPDGDYTISTAPLRDFLDRSLLNDAQTWLDQLAGQLEAYNGAGTPVLKVRANLQRILARPEFAGNGPPSAWDRFRERINAWIEDFLKRLLHLARQHPTTGHVVFWVAIIGGVGLLGFLLFRLWNRDRYELKLSGSATPAVARSWEQWLRAARAASDEGDMRKAIQCAYWAGVARLQVSGALPRGLTYTPREYLRLASAPQQGYFGSPAAINPLRTLTSYLERFWYGRVTATADDFSACLGSLEALGCKVD